MLWEFLPVRPQPVSMLCKDAGQPVSVLCKEGGLAPGKEWKALATEGAYKESQVADSSINAIVVIRMDAEVVHEE